MIAFVREPRVDRELLGVLQGDGALSAARAGPVQHHAAQNRWFSVPSTPRCDLAVVSRM